jgi:hypothetical protein
VVRSLLDVRNEIYQFSIFYFYFYFFLQNKQNFSHVCFLHDWGINWHGRHVIHDRVSRIYTEMNQRKGFNVWFDEDYIRGDIHKTISDGIQHSCCIVLFLTQKYIDLIYYNNPDEIGYEMEENCVFGFEKMLEFHEKSRIIPVVMDTHIKETVKSWRKCEKLSKVFHKCSTVIDMSDLYLEKLSAVPSTRVTVARGDSSVSSESRSVQTSNSNSNNSMNWEVTDPVMRDVRQDCDANLTNSKVVKEKEFQEKCDLLAETIRTIVFQ